MTDSLTPTQLELASRPANQRIFLQGPAGSGKTTTAAARLQLLLESGVTAGSILIFVPQRTLAAPFQTVLQTPELSPGGVVDVLTVGGLARRMVDLFWPLAARPAGFAHPERPPAFLTLETAQYYMANLVRPLLEEGLFESITIDRNRLYSQIIDNLNKAALVGFPISEIGERLKQGWSGDSSQLRVFDDAQRCANLFRSYCLENNLLDFSLQLEIFRERLWPSLLCRAYLKDTYRHLIYDNIEEDTPAAHDLVAEWLPDFDSAFLVYDQDAGYRRFLGADPLSAHDLADHCQECITLEGSFVTPPHLELLAQTLGHALNRVEAPSCLLPTPENLPELDMPADDMHFYPQMLDWAAHQTARLIDQGVPPGEIAVLAPLLPDSLRFALTERFDRLGIPYRSHRPSRALSDEPTARCLLTLAKLAHPAWGLRPTKYEVAYTLIQAIDGLDLVRAQLLSETVYRTREGRAELGPFERLNPDMQDRITFRLGMHYEGLRTWLAEYAANPTTELDTFFSRLFGEVLAQPGFGFHTQIDAGQTTANLIESAQKFRWAVEHRPDADPTLAGREYLQMVQDGVLAAQYIQSWQPPAADAVFLAPAYTFLMNNYPVSHQFWLDTGSNAWFERLYQPLTHPYILSRSWAPGQRWTAVEEYEANCETLYRQALGLLRRCRVQVHLAYCRMGESGYEQRGMLIKALERILREAGAHD